MLTLDAMAKLNNPDNPRRQEILDYFNNSINYRPHEPKAIRILEVTLNGVKFELDNGETLYREWF